MKSSKILCFISAFILERPVALDIWLNTSFIAFEPWGKNLLIKALANLGPISVAVPTSVVEDNKGSAPRIIGFFPISLIRFSFSVTWKNEGSTPFESELIADWMFDIVEPTS